NEPGFVMAATLHHFKADNGRPHLWMATPLDKFAALPQADFDRQVQQRAKEKFTHLRVTIEPSTDLREAASRVRAINRAGMVADLVLASIPQDPPARHRYLADVIPRFASFNITWMGAPGFEKLPNARTTLKDIGQLLKQYDGYDHLRGSMAEASSAPLASD